MDNYFLKTKPVGRLLFSLGLPMMLSMLINSLYNIIDSVYVSRLGTEAVAALSIIFPLQNLTIAVSVGLGIGINSVIARLMGAEKKKEADKAAAVGIFLAIVHAVLFFLVGWLLVPGYVGIYAQAGSTTYSWAVSYGKIVLMLSLPYLIYLVLEKLFQSLGWMKISMLGMISAALTNIILDPIMIFGFMGFPAMGVAGAALATVIGQALGMVFFLVVFKWSDFPIHIYFSQIRFNKRLVKNIYNVGIPAALTMALPSFLVAILNSILISYSEISVAVLGLYYKIQTFFYMPCSGLLQGMRPLVSYNYGAHEYGRVQKAVLLSFLINGCILTAGFLILQVMPAQVMGFFDPEPALKEQGIEALRIISAGFTASVVPVVCNGTFESLGLGKDSLIISLLRQLIIMIPIAYLLSNLFGVIGVWWSFPVSEFLTAIIALYMLNVAFKRLGIRIQAKKADL